MYTEKELRLKIDSYKFEAFGTSLENLKERIVKSGLLVLNTDMKFIDCVVKVNVEYNIFDDLNQFTKDIFQHEGKLLTSALLNYSLEDIKKRYTDPYEEVEERMMFRMELYRDGWDIEQIERYISKYLLHEEEFRLPNDIILTEGYYNIMVRMYYIHKKDNIRKKGRPSLPNSLKEYLKNKHNLKVRDMMTGIYRNSNEYKRIKEYLLTTEEIRILKEIIPVEHEDILYKISNLYI
jgi:hypothetical protein